MNESSQTIVVTGIDWIGSGIRSIESALGKLFQAAEYEIILTVYSITTGSDLLFEWLETALTRGVKIRMVINHFEDQHASAVNRLNDLMRQYHHLQLYDFNRTESDLHAKVVVVDRKSALVGSSNLSKRGLLANHELAVLVQGPDAGSIARTIDRLIESLSTSRIY
jgi:phosphatidylserine/phosphatidylglycerophosphate/cardiolipin synthase-like enzyme